MDEKLIFYLKDFVRNEEPASETIIEQTQKQLDFLLPTEYLDIMKEFNGGEGEIGENSWLCLFPLDELISTNKNYDFLMNEIPDFFLFGKDAADTGYAFNKKKGTIHSFGLMSDFKLDPIEFCADNFLDFIEYLYKI